MWDSSALPAHTQPMASGQQPVATTAFCLHISYSNEFFNNTFAFWPQLLWTKLNSKISFTDRLSVTGPYKLSPEGSSSFQIAQWALSAKVSFYLCLSLRLLLSSLYPWDCQDPICCFSLAPAQDVSWSLPDSHLFTGTSKLVICCQGNSASFKCDSPKDSGKGGQDLQGLAWCMHSYMKPPFRIWMAKTGW